MSQLSDFIRWDAGCWNYPNQQLTGSEYTWGGLADYGQSFPCPNGLPLNMRPLIDSEGWRRRVEKARLDIAQHKEHIDWHETIETAHREWKSDDVARLIAISERLYE